MRLIRGRSRKSSEGSTWCQNSSTGRTLVKKRWPPMSNRQPSRSTVRLIPPTTVSSSTTTTGSPASASWRAAVSPAGPAPMTTTGPIRARPTARTMQQVLRWLRVDARNVVRMSALRRGPLDSGGVGGVLARLVSSAAELGSAPAVTRPGTEPPVVVSSGGSPDQSMPCTGPPPTGPPPGALPTGAPGDASGSRRIVGRHRPPAKARRAAGAPGSGDHHADEGEEGVARHPGADDDQDGHSTPRRAVSVDAAMTRGKAPRA